MSLSGADSLGNVDQGREVVDRSLDELVVGNGELDGLLRAEIHTAATAPAGVADDCPTVDQVDSVDKTDVLGARSATHASICHRDRDTGHFGDFIAEERGNVGQHSPEATARTTGPT